MVSGGDLFGDEPERNPPASRREKAARRAKDLAEGHRARLRMRFMDGGDGAVAEYELLELLLFRAIPRRDVKPLAKELVARFGDIAGVLAAEPARLREIDGLGDAAIAELKIVAAVVRAAARVKAVGRRSLADGDAVVAYLRAVMGRSGVEAFHVLFLDTKNQLIRDETMNRGVVDQVAVFPAQIAKRALELDAAAIILAHNHPSGDCTPSRADVAMTKKIVAAADTVGVRVLDHIIVGAGAALSFRAERLL